MMRVTLSALLFATLTCLSVGCEKTAESAGAAAIAAASGGKVKVVGDGKVEVTTAEGTAKLDVSGDKGVAKMTGENADGTKFNAAFGAGAKAPDGFPLPIMDGLGVMQGAVTEKDGKKSYAVMAQTQKPAKAIADFYEPELKKAGLTVTRSDSNLGGMVIIALNGEGGGRTMNVAVQEAGGQTTVTMGGDW